MVIDPVLLALAEKYEELLRLRRLHEGPDEPDPRPAMRELATRFPGALKELDQLPTPEIERRRGEVARAIADGEPARWMVVTARYHALLRAALEERRQGAATSSTGRISEDVMEQLARELAITVEAVKHLVRDADR